MALLFQRYRERVKQVCQRMDAFQGRISRIDALRLVQTQLGPLWDRARSMVERLSATVLLHQQQLYEHLDSYVANQVWI